jgi:hypothetical protein
MEAWIDGRYVIVTDQSCHLALAQRSCRDHDGK